ncbi:phosphatase PAP2 family protein [Acetobacterium sp.]|uniref:phosphatase PAP2 family protein n=1 Tax=Acetobacterium sp. TaxID=1872094 RepID=UPI0039C85DA1
MAYEIQLLIPKPLDLYFPSGYSASVFAFVWAYFITRKDLWRWGLLFFALLVSFTRLYLFVHYPTNVLGSIIIGILYCVSFQMAGVSGLRIILSW